MIKGSQCREKTIKNNREYRCQHPDGHDGKHESDGVRW